MPGVSKREVLAWASYDFANSGYTTVILTAVYNAFFVSVVAENAVWATFAWTLTITLSNLLSIAVIPVISALADAKANKRFWLAVMTGICCMSTATLAYTGPGTLASAVFLIVISNTAFNAGVSLNLSVSLGVGKAEAFGKVSGWGWSFGYLGGIVSLAACLLIVFEGQKAGLPPMFMCRIRQCPRRLFSLSWLCRCSCMSKSVLNLRISPLKRLSKESDRNRSTVSNFLNVIRNS